MATRRGSSGKGRGKSGGGRKASGRSGSSRSASGSSSASSRGTRSGSGSGTGRSTTRSSRPTGRTAGDGAATPRARDATAILREDHEKVDALFRRIAAAGSPGEKARTFEKVLDELTVHAHVEETVFYPAVREVRDRKGEALVQESVAEHAEVKDLLAEIAALGPEEAAFDMQVDELRRSVEHHVAEEQGEMFPLAEEHLGPERLRELGREIARAKRAWKAGRGGDA
jgi:hypothetical protein